MTDKKTIAQAFVDVCSKVENVKRDTDGQVGNQRYKYATLESVLEMLNPLLADAGLALAQYVDGDVLKATLIHESGEKMEFGGYNLGVLGKHQERGSACTYGRRYQLCAIFGVTQEDDDGHAASNPKLFANASKRNEWCKNVLAQIQQATSREELQIVWDNCKGMIASMKAADEHEQIGAENIVTQFKMAGARVDKEAAMLRRADRGDFDGVTDVE